MNKRTINNFIFVLMFLLCGLISIGYSSLSKTLSVSGDLAYRKIADVRVTNASYASNENGGVSNSVTFGYNKLISGVTFPNLDSTITYNVTVTNYSNKDMTISSASDSSSRFDFQLINYSYDQKINANSSVTFQVKLTHAASITSGSTSSYNVTVTFVFEEFEEDCLRVNSNRISGYTTYNMYVDYSSTEIYSYNYLYGPILSDSIEKIGFTTTNVPDSNAIGYWDVSNKQNGSIMAWYFDDDSDGLYEVVIGQNGEFIRANKSSDYSLI